jgi:hypothetical protein
MVVMVCQAAHGTTQTYGCDVIVGTRGVHAQTLSMKDGNLRTEMTERVG